MQSKENLKFLKLYIFASNLTFPLKLSSKCS